jgi:hydrogenase maturation factor
LDRRLGGPQSWYEQRKNMRKRKLCVRNMQTSRLQWSGLGTVSSEGMNLKEGNWNELSSSLKNKFVPSINEQQDQRQTQELHKNCFENFIVQV